jgi:hypothetical protein
MLINESIATKATYTGAGGAVFFGLTANEIGIYGGLIIGFIGLCFRIYFDAKAHILLVKKYKSEGITDE